MLLLFLLRPKSRLPWLKLKRPVLNVRELKVDNFTVHPHYSGWTFGYLALRSS